MPRDSSDREKPYFDEDLHLAYLNTAYTCGPFILKIGEPHPGFSDFLAREGLSNYAFITAWNPRSRALPEAENVARDRKFRQQLIVRGLKFMPAAARDPSEVWLPEEGVFIFDAGAAVVMDLAVAWEQNAVVMGSRNGIPALHWV